MLLLSVLGDLFFLLVALCHFLCLQCMYLDLDSLLFIFLGIDVLGSFVFQYFCNILRHDHVDYDLSSLLFFSKTRWTSSLNCVSIFIPFYLFVFAGYFLGNFLSPSFQFMNTSSAVSNLLVRPPNWNVNFSDFIFRRSSLSYTSAFSLFTMSFHFHTVSFNDLKHNCFIVSSGLCW